MVWDGFFGKAGAGKIEFGEFVVQKWLRSRGICRLPGMETGRCAYRLGLQAMEFDTFSGRWCSGWIFDSKAGQDKSTGSAVRRQQGLVGALDPSVRLSL